MFGQRKTLIEHSVLLFPFLLPFFLPFILPILTSTPFGALSYVVSLVGWCVLVVAKWPLIKQGKVFTFGPKSLDAKGRNLYYAGYAIIGIGMLGMFYSRFG